MPGVVPPRPPWPLIARIAVGGGVSWCTVERESERAIETTHAAKARRERNLRDRERAVVQQALGKVQTAGLGDRDR